MCAAQVGDGNAPDRASLQGKLLDLLSRERLRALLDAEEVDKLQIPLTMEQLRAGHVLELLGELAHGVYAKDAPMPPPRALCTWLRLFGLRLPRSAEMKSEEPANFLKRVRARFRRLEQPFVLLWRRR